MIFNLDDGSKEALTSFKLFELKLTELGLNNLVSSVTCIEGYSIFQLYHSDIYCIDSISKIQNIAKEVLPNVSLVPIENYIRLNEKTRAHSLAPN